MQLTTQRLELRIPGQKDAAALLDHAVRNAEFLKPWEPVRGPDYFTLKSIRKQIIVDRRGFKRKSDFRFVISKKGEGRIIGTIALANIVYGPFQSCFLGYRLDKDEVSKGYMTEAISAVAAFAFDEIGLHRIEANIIPRNAASRRAVEKLGFVEEGISRRYLKINGVWEDHLHYVLLSDQVRIAGPLPESTLEDCFGLMSRSIEGLRAAGIDQWDEIYPDRKTVHDDLRAGHTFAAVSDQGVLATVVLNEDQSPEWQKASWPMPQARSLVVHRLAVDPRFQRQGLGEKLMRFAEEFAKKGGYDSVRLDAFPKNFASVALYEKLGYKNAGTVRFRKGDFYCFEKAVR